MFSGVCSSADSTHQLMYLELQRAECRSLQLPICTGRSFNEEP